MDTNTLLAQASRAALRGNKPQAQAILAELIRQEPQNEAAWLLLAQVVERKEHAIDCLERVLRLNPNNEQARRRLEELKQQQTLYAQQGNIESPPQPVPNVPPRLKPCPYCAEMIQEAAIVCRFCGRDLATGQVPSVPREEQAKRDEQERLTRQREREEQKRLKEERKRTQQAAQSQVKTRERLEKSQSSTLRRERVILGVLSLVVCAGLVGGALLVWQARNLLFPHPIEATVLIPVTETFTPQPSPTLRPSSTPRPVATERDVRNKLCETVRSRLLSPYRINQRNGIVTVWIYNMSLGRQSCGDSLRIKVAVVNDSNISVHVNPLHFTAIDFNRRTYNLDSDTFGLDNYLDATDLLPDTYTDGWLEFDIAWETPRYIVYDDGFSPIIQFDLAEELAPR